MFNRKFAFYSRIFVFSISTLALLMTNVSGIAARGETADTPQTTTETYLQIPVFGDVPETYWAWSSIVQLYNAGITGGCSINPLNYCPEASVTRAQMAIFLLRGIHSSSYSPPAVGTSTGFGDVPTNYWAAAWIKQLAAEGITGGCGNGNYCPESPVTRAQIAVFLLRSKYGVSYNPPVVGGGTGFGDVPTNYWAAAWIKQLIAEGIASGCGNGMYCPDVPVTRAQMAVFMVRTFLLTLSPSAPYANAPACPTHDPNTWHGLWDYQRGCHYDHTHGDDPSLADKYFGPLGKFWNGATISYPFNSGPAENGFKHPGYKISVRMPGYHPWPACGTEDNTDITGDHSDNCIIASRTEYHLLGSLADVAHRYHSYWVEVYICKPPYRQPQDCGIMRTGGLLDYGQLQAPHYDARVVRPGGTIDFGNGVTMDYMADGPDLPSTSGEPYVFSIPYSAAELDSYRRNPPQVDANGMGKATIDQWSSNDFDCEPRPAGDPCHNQHTHVMFQIGDSFTLVDTQNLNNVRWICWGEAGCEYNGSLIGMNEIAVRVMDSWPTNSGGFVAFNGYSDKWGNPRFDNSCTSVSANCVPFILEHAPVGVAASRSDNLCECVVWEYDIYFNGKPSGWIKFPN